ncbi:MAG: hypothetical protein EAZ53_08040 [Bacteroidetes bacterium]|nr:MAG: hypothetical protein EAZ53_08040 [Bacteroidota bacterium]
MFKSLSTTLLITIISISVSIGQDIILKKTGEEVKAKILEVSPTEVKYKQFDNQSGPTFILYKSDVFMLKYENGTKDVFKIENPIIIDTNKTEEVKPLIPTTTPVIKPTFQDGVNDANKYYKNYKGAGTGNFIGGFFLGICALPIPIATGSSSPSEFNLGYPNPGLFQDPSYRQGYLYRAKKIKQNKVWSNWAFGCVTGGAVSVAIQLALRR